MSRRGQVAIRPGQEQRREFINLFKKLCYKYSDWQVWQDFIYMAAAALSQPCDFKEEREKEYLEIINKYDKSEQEIFPQMLAKIVRSFEQEQFADILGDLYMQLEMGNKWKGQFFTPYHISVLMAKMSADDVKSEIDKKGYMTVSDMCCGGGAMLIAFAEHCYNEKVNYQNHVLFVAQDIDPVVAKMCYVQMSLLGMPGYVIIGNSITQPPIGHVLFPKAGKATSSTPEADIWYTSSYFSEVWNCRRVATSISMITDSLIEKSEIREEVPTYNLSLKENTSGQYSLF